MTLHVVGLPHTITRKEFAPCAYTQKLVNFCTMMPTLGYEVIHYGAEGAEVPCEHVTIMPTSEQEQVIPDLWGFKEGRQFAAKFHPNEPYWTVLNYRAGMEILRRRKPGDLLCLIAGATQRSIADMVPDIKPVEWGIGYSGIFSKYKVFESYAWMHSIYCQGQADANNPNGGNYDCVIPNSFNVDDFELGYGGDYALFLGRLTQRKGLHIALEACEAAGVHLKIAGQGGTVDEDGTLNWENMYKEKGDWEYVGVVDFEERSKLMGGAICTLLPTMYLEPFGGVAVESMLCGTPAITSDWGAFPETVAEGISGSRCHTLKEWRDAILHWKEQKGHRADVRSYAASKYDINVVKHQYDRYFQRLETLDRKGWYEL